MFKIFLGLTAAAGLAAAATSPISSAAVAKPSATPGESSCSSAVNNILASSDPGIGCIAPHGLTQIYAQTQQNASVPVLTTAIDSWLTSMCSVGSCSEATLDHIAANVSAGCGSSFDETPLPNATALASTLYLSYFDVREMMCLQKREQKRLLHDGAPKCGEHRSIRLVRPGEGDRATRLRRVQPRVQRMHQGRVQNLLEHNPGDQRHSIVGEQMRGDLHLYVTRSRLILPPASTRRRLSSSSTSTASAHSARRRLRSLSSPRWLCSLLYC
ncbi:hypothetical protein B0H11DRAFT_1974726, partial [Mycena galericulata]